MTHRIQIKKAMPCLVVSRRTGILKGEYHHHWHTKIVKHSREGDGKLYLITLVSRINLHVRCGTKKRTVNQKYAFIKKSTILTQSLRNSVKIR